MVNIELKQKNHKDLGKYKSYKDLDKYKDYKDHSKLKSYEDHGKYKNYKKHSKYKNHKKHREFIRDEDLENYDNIIYYTDSFFRKGLNIPKKGRNNNCNLNLIENFEKIQDKKDKKDEEDKKITFNLIKDQNINKFNIKKKYKNKFKKKVKFLAGNFWDKDPKYKNKEKQQKKEVATSFMLIDYKNTELQSFFIDRKGQINSRDATGIKTKQHRYITNAIKKARMSGLHSFIY